MQSITVKLDSIEKIRNFVSAITMVDGDFDLVSERFVVDAKSIMGIFSLDLSKPLRLDIHNEAAVEQVKEQLTAFIV